LSFQVDRPQFRNFRFGTIKIKEFRIMDNKGINKDVILQTLYTQTGELKKFGVQRIGLFGHLFGVKIP
jgi:hypothetical protein